MTLEVSFNKSSSSLYDRAVDLASRASDHQTTGEGRKTRHTAIYTQERAQLVLALELLNLIRSWKGMSVKVNGEPAEFLRVHEVLTCYMRSLHVTDYRAYCWRVEEDDDDLGPSTFISVEYDEPVDPAIDPVMTRIKQKQAEAVLEEYEDGETLIIPCRLIYATPNRKHPSTIEGQIQAAAVDAGSWWCPHFNQDVK